MPSHPDPPRYLPLPLSSRQMSIATMAQRSHSRILIARLPFSACACSERNKPTRNRKSSNLVKSPSTRHKMLGTTGANLEDRREWLNNHEQGVSYSLSKMSLSRRRELAKLGYGEPEITAICDDVGSWLNGRTSVALISWWLNGGE